MQHATAPQKRNRRFKRNMAIDKRKEKRKRYKARKKDDIKEIIGNAPDQNVINLSNAVLSEDQKTFLKKGPSFIPISTDINWYDVRKDFTKFNNKIRHFAHVSDQPVQQQKQQQQLEVNPENIVSTSINVFPPGKPSPVSSDSKQLYKSKKSNNSSLELFIDSIEKEIFNPKNIRKTRNNLNKDEKAALKEIKSWEDKVIRVQDKGSRFVVLNTSDYVEKVEHQINRSSFSRLDEDTSPEFKQKVNNWLNKWPGKINEKWKKFITPNNSSAGKMYGIVILQ